MQVPIWMIPLSAQPLQQNSTNRIKQLETTPTDDIKRNFRYFRRELRILRGMINQNNHHCEKSISVVVNPIKNIQSSPMKCSRGTQISESHIVAIQSVWRGFRMRRLIKKHKSYLLSRSFDFIMKISDQIINEFLYDRVADLFISEFSKRSFIKRFGIPSETFCNHLIKDLITVCVTKIVTNILSNKAHRALMTIAVEGGNNVFVKNELPCRQEEVLRIYDDVSHELVYEMCRSVVLSVIERNLHNHLSNCKVIKSNVRISGTTSQKDFMGESMKYFFFFDWNCLKKIN